jgi:hypothetical protein
MTVANPMGGVQAFASYYISLLADNAMVDDVSELNAIVAFPALGKDLAVPVFAGQVSYAVVVEGVAFPPCASPAKSVLGSR